MAWSKETIHQRYIAGYITDDQLRRFVSLGQITQDEFDAWYTEKHGENQAE